MPIQVARQIIVSAALIYVSLQITFLIYRNWNAPVGRYLHTYLYVGIAIIVIHGLRIIFIVAGLKDLMVPLINMKFNDLTIVASGVVVILLAAIIVIVTNYLATRDLKAERMALKKLSSVDYLTQIPNCRMLFEHLEKVMSKGHEFALVITDMDEFKTINDTYGHLIGDAILVAYAKALCETKEADVFTARFGGDEFIFIVENFKSVDALRQEIKHLVDAQPTVIQLDTMTFKINSSVGVSLFPNDATTVSDLIKKADDALYYVKANNKNSFIFYQDIESK